MIAIQKIILEYRIGILLGMIALFFSFIIGVISGVGIKIVLLRSLVMVLIFSFLGIAIIFILKRFVPELHEVLSKLFIKNNIVAGKASDSEDIENKSLEKGVDSDLTNASGSGASMGNKDSNGGDGEQFNELSEKSFPKYETVEDSEIETTVNIPVGKLGKHIIEKQKIAKYEPKLMAEAIRTMMSRNQD